MEGKRNRGEVTAELSEKVWARLCRENALVASEVWVDDASRVDFVAYRPHRPRDRSSNHATAAELESGTFTFVEVKSCMDDFTSGHGRTFEGDENWLVCPLELADSLASKGMLPKGAARVQEAERHRREAECLFEYRFSCSPYSAMAYEAFHPELCERRVSKRRKQELVVYRLPDGSEPSGYAEMSVPADYADSSHVVPSVFISGTGGDRAWRDIDFDEAERKFAAAARRAAAFREGRPKLMQDEARRAAIRETRHRVCTAPILKSIKEIHR